MRDFSMAHWLIDDPSTVYLILGIIALGLCVGWWKTRKRAYAILLGTVTLLFGLVWALGFIDTDSKQIKRKLDQMAAGVAARNPDKVFENFSEQFRIGALDKSNFRQRTTDYIRGGQVKEIVIWDYLPRQVSRENRVAVVTFKVKPKGSDPSGSVFYKGVDAGSSPFYNCRANFALDQDGQWRLRGFELFGPQIDPMGGNALALPF